jgi:hypothetical protein
LFVKALRGEVAVGADENFFSGNELGEFLRRGVVNLREGHQHPQNGTVSIRSLSAGDIVFMKPK